jgi:hypothetical protein
MSFLSSIGKALVNLDIKVNEKWGKKHWWSPFGGSKGETISSSFGEEEAVELYSMYQSHHTLTFPFIPLKYPLGQFFEDICTATQTVITMKKCIHGLQAIEWDGVNGKDLQIKYPGIKQVVEKYLISKGINP